MTKYKFVNKSILDTSDIKLTASVGYQKKIIATGGLGFIDLSRKGINIPSLQKAKDLYMDMLEDFTSDYIEKILSEEKIKNGKNAKYYKDKAAGYSNMSRKFFVNLVKASIRGDSHATRVLAYEVIDGGLYVSNRRIGPRFKAFLEFSAEQGSEMSKVDVARYTISGKYLFMKNKHKGVNLAKELFDNTKDDEIKKQILKFCPEFGPLKEKSQIESWERINMPTLQEAKDLYMDLVKELTSGYIEKILSDEKIKNGKNAKYYRDKADGYTGRYRFKYQTKSAANLVKASIRGDSQATRLLAYGAGFMNRRIYEHIGYMRGFAKYKALIELSAKQGSEMSMVDIARFTQNGKYNFKKDYAKGIGMAKNLWENTTDDEVKRRLLEYISGFEPVISESESEGESDYDSSESESESGEGSDDSSASEGGN